jgi:hypothetical protein
VKCIDKNDNAKIKKALILKWSKNKTQILIFKNTKNKMRIKTNFKMKSNAKAKLIETNLMEIPLVGKELKYMI